jgi:acyl carrier protein
MEIALKPSKETIEDLKELVVEVTQANIDPSSIRDTANLFNDCGLDSTSVIDLVLSIEERFGVSIDEDELVVTLFQDLSKLCSLIDAKRQGAESVL